jgi:hypothetical protein
VLETRELRAPEGFYALGVREDDEPWHLLIATEEDELWLSWGEVADLDEAQKVDFSERTFEELPKLCALLGMEFEEISDRYPGLIEWQYMCLERIGGGMRRSLARASKEEVLHWRHEVMSLSQGEVTYAGLTGSDPRAVSN